MGCREGTRERIFGATYDTTLHSCVERRDAQFSDVTLHPNISRPEADMDWMEMDDFQVYITFLYVNDVVRTIKITFLYHETS